MSYAAFGWTWPWEDAAKKAPPPPVPSPPQLAPSVPISFAKCSEAQAAAQKSLSPDCKVSWEAQTKAADGTWLAPCVLSCPSLSLTQNISADIGPAFARPFPWGAAISVGLAGAALLWLSSPREWGGQ